MLRPEINDLLTQTGPKTPMGDLFRQYWMPACLAEELPRTAVPPSGSSSSPSASSPSVTATATTASSTSSAPTAGRPVVRPERGGWPPLPVPRLEVRHDGSVRRRPVGGRQLELRAERQADRLPAGQDRRRAVDLHGRPGHAASAPGVGVRDGAAGADLHLQALAAEQLAAGLRGRHRLQPRDLPALGRAEDRPALQARRATSTTSTTPSRSSRWPTARVACSWAPAATPRTGTTTGGSRRGSCPTSRWCPRAVTTRSTGTSGCRSTTRTAGPTASTTTRSGR